MNCTIVKDDPCKMVFFFFFMGVCAKPRRFPRPSSTSRVPPAVSGHSVEKMMRNTTDIFTGLDRRPAKFPLFLSQILWVQLYLCGSVSRRGLGSPLSASGDLFWSRRYSGTRK